MSKDEIKSEINQVLDHFSNGALAELLHFLKKLNKQNLPGRVNLNDLQKILKGDHELLQKLAQ
jgi:hypothetical protein